jgi:hypothetical protein
MDTILRYVLLVLVLTLLLTVGLKAAMTFHPMTPLAERVEALSR